ncbi:glutamate 5-kinase [Alloiococcus sp. CFN-8]|uniref:glutamate 5-kinase n=1 Tax=Alloiococcus sp. CFN-8 TaxID=3416081 RepID=UPI003CF2AD0D
MKKKSKQTLVVKIGSSSLTDSLGYLAKEKIQYFAKDVAKLKALGHRVVIVTSGSIAAGFSLLGYKERPKTVEGKQAAAAVGQGLLIEEYTKALKKYHCLAAQILLTRGDFSDKRRFKNAARTLEVLLEKGAVPVINENDTVSIEELKFGDNDTLSAHVASMVHADLLLILTDIDGLYTADPRKDSNAERLNYIEEITKEIEDLAGSAGSSIGTGGMRSKIIAAKISTTSGVPVLITSAGENSIYNSIEGTIEGSYFEGRKRKLKNKLHWVTFYSHSKGTLIIDSGAQEALSKGGKSLLPKGIIKVVGNFSPGDVVEVVNNNKKLIGKGLVEYSSSELIELKGLSSLDIKKVTGRTKTVAIHRDNWIGNETMKKEGI